MIALLVVGAMGIVSTKVFARSSSAPTGQTQPCDQEDDDSAEAPEAADTDTDNIEEQCGDQNEADDQEANDTEEEDAVTVPAGVTVITTEQAKAAAIAVHPGTVIQTELDNENGQWVYSVEFAGGVDVKIDTITGSFLSTESGQD